jgi:hypothetical protein
MNFKIFRASPPKIRDVKNGRFWAQSMEAPGKFWKIDMEFKIT